MLKLKSAIYGLIIGDALGVPFEFKSRGSFCCTDMIGHGTHNQPVGTWSDDTSMTLATLDSLKQNKNRINIEDMRDKFNNWLYQGKYTTDGNVFDYGITTKQALDSKRGLDDFYSNGNGSLMRILPLAFIETSEEDIEKVSAITHAHLISKEACKIYVKIAKGFISSKELNDILKDLNTSDIFKRLKNIGSLKEDNIKSSGYVVDTLEAALWCLCTSNSYEEALLKAVNLGNDTDTVGAVTGGLAGIVYGYDNIPKKWIKNLRKKEEIEKYLF